MIHTFKSETSRLFRATLFLTLGGMLLLFWHRLVVPGALSMIVAVFLIRSFLHTEYQITEQTLRIVRGYLPAVEVPLTAVTSVTPGGGFCSGLACARPTVTVTAAGRAYKLAPRRPDLFIRQLRQATGNSIT